MTALYALGAAVLVVAAALALVGVAAMVDVWARGRLDELCGGDDRGEDEREDGL